MTDTCEIRFTPQAIAVLRKTMEQTGTVGWRVRVCAARDAERGLRYRLDITDEPDGAGDTVTVQDSVSFVVDDTSRRLMGPTIVDVPIDPQQANHFVFLPRSAGALSQGMVPHRTGFEKATDLAGGMVVNYAVNKIILPAITMPFMAIGMIVGIICAFLVEPRPTLAARSAGAPLLEWAIAAVLAVGPLLFGIWLTSFAMKDPAQRQSFILWRILFGGAYVAGVALGSLILT